tara:strand:+ start:582 stop:842 length:261 start_codon:yes stop_codon:yes gene_type:complete
MKINGVGHAPWNTANGRPFEAPSRSDIPARLKMIWHRPDGSTVSNPDASGSETHQSWSINNLAVLFAGSREMSTVSLDLNPAQLDH